MHLRSRIFFIAFIYPSLFHVHNAFPQAVLARHFEIRTESVRPKILKLLKDHSGLLWTGTDQGIFYFDGTDFNSIETGRKLSGIRTTALYLAPDSVIWAGFEDGSVISIKNFEATDYHPQEGIPKVSVTAFGQTADGALYFATQGEGVYCDDGKHLYNFSTDDGLSDNFCYDLVVNPDNSVCVATDKGLNFLSKTGDKKDILQFGTDDGLPDEIITSLFYSSSGMLYAGTYDKGPAALDPISHKVVTGRTVDWHYGQINAIIEVGGEHWFATGNQGVIRMTKNGNLNPVNFHSGSPGFFHKVNDLVIDEEENVWIAEGTRLTRTTGKKLSYYNHNGSGQVYNVHCILYDSKGNLWYSPDQQLVKVSITGDKWSSKKYTITTPVMHTDIVSLYEDPYGFIWIATLGEGLFRLDPESGNLRRVTRSADIESESILTVTGKGDIVWTGGFNGTGKYRITSGESINATIEKIEEPATKEIFGEYVYSIFIDSQDRVWFGTDGRGACMLENGLLKEITAGEDLQDKTVYSFAEDDRQRIWITTDESGIACISGDSLLTVHVSDGLSDPSAATLFKDAFGNIVVVHNTGLDIIDPSTLSITYYTIDEQLGELNPDLNSFAHGKDSTVWIGTEKGILRYAPSASDAVHSPGLMFRSVSLFLEPLQHSASRSFSHDENNFRFDYIGLWYSDPKRLNFSYILEGFSQKWENTKDQTVTFPRLPPGNYTFKVRASLNNRFDESSGIEWSFVIAEPIWQRWWFRVIFALAITLFILALIRRREKRLRNVDLLQKEKIQFQFETLKSQVNPHFLFNSFNTLISVIEKDPALAVEYVEKLSDFFRNIVTYRDKNIISLEDEIGLLDSYVFIQKKRYGSHLKLSIDVPYAIQKDFKIPPLTLQLLAENAIKHNSISSETPLNISLSEAGGKLIVRNNINRKIRETGSTGLGLENIISRYRLLGSGEVEINKDNNYFTVILPLTPS